MEVRVRSLSAMDPTLVLWFFDQPTKPCFVPKGTNRDVYYKIPQAHYPEEYKPIVDKLESRFTALKEGLIINVPPLPPHREPNLTEVKKLPKTSNFTLFNPAHVRCASIIINYLLDVESENLVSLCTKIQMEINPYLFEYALSIAFVNRQDTSKLPLPSPVAHLPEFYLKHDVINKATQLGTVVVDSEDRDLIDVPVTASDLDIEHRVAYFREDIGINIHHWHWHVIYPFDIEGRTELVNKDRRGELFYYMHQQVLARYNAERLCNKLLRVKSLNYLRGEIDPPYFPKLSSPYTDKNWASRHMNAEFQDLHRGPLLVRILDVESWRSRILDAIQFGGYYDNESKFHKFEEDTGIDILGNMVESCILSPRRNFYGNLHNFGHLLIAYSHDPDNRYLENIGVMGDNRTAMRDPIFYRWHAFIDDIFQELKSRLSPYTKMQLTFDKIEIKSFRTVTHINNAVGVREKLENVLITYTQRDNVNLAHGVDVASAGPVYVRFPHLQHSDFDYEIRVLNNGAQKKGTVRIFMAPTYDETTKLFTMPEQRRLYIELDKFQVTLNANGETCIKRKSNESTVTIPFKQMFLDIEDIINESNEYQQSLMAYCGCGWPEYMLIPKGELAGMAFKLFVMISDFELDKVENNTADEKGDECKECKSAAAYCGLSGKKYPDKRAMGYPFDRPVPTEINSIDDFLTPNMSAIDIKIVHKMIIVQGDSVITYAA